MVRETQLHRAGDPRRGSRYPWATDPADPHSARAARRETQSKLVARYLHRLRTTAPRSKVREFAPGGRPVSDFHRRLLLNAALEVFGVDPTEKSKKTAATSEARRLARDAEEFFPWAWHGKKVNNANAITAAEFAVQMAYDWSTRSEVMYSLGTPPPVVWWQAGGEPRCWPPQDKGLPIPENDVARLLAAVEAFSGRYVPKVCHVPAFAGLTASATWQHDAARPPVQAVRFAASLIDQQGLGTERLRVVGVELGHSVAAQVLSACLPHADVVSLSSAFAMPTEATVDVPPVAATSPVNHGIDLGGGGRAEQRRLRRLLGDLVADDLNADAVVVNLPSLKQLAWFHDVVRRHRAEVPVPMTGQTNDAYHRMRPTLVGQGWWEHLLEYALDQLAPHGLLVVMGDVESGIHVHAKLRLDVERSLAPLHVTDDGGTEAIIDYQHGVSRRLGVLEATGRVLSAWRRVA